MTVAAPSIEKHRIDKFRRNLDIVMLAYAREFPFWGVMSERCQFSITNSLVDTACIDKFGKITFNIDFYEKLTDKQFLFLIAHEISHFVFEHAPRMGSRDHIYWNMATDYAINLMLKYQFEKDEFFIKEGLLDQKYDGMNAEQIYDLLVKDNPPKKKLIIVDIPQDNGEVGDEDGEGEGNSDSDGDGDGDGNTIVIRPRRVPLPKNERGKSKEQFDQEMKDYIRQAVCEAYACAKNQGCMPAGMERIIVGHLKPKVNWLQALRQKLRFGASRKASRDITWTVPNRRFLDKSYVFPSNIGPDQPKIAFAIDTSGSMSPQDLKQAVSELEDIRKKFNAKVYFLDCDAGVYESRWIDPYEPLPCLQGGGGTDFAPVFKHLVEKRIKPDYCVFFTDGYGNFGDDPTQNFDVLWVLTNLHVQPPFGDVVRVDVDNDSN